MLHLKKGLFAHLWQPGVKQAICQVCLSQNILFSFQLSWFLLSFSLMLYLICFIWYPSLLFWPWWLGSSFLLPFIAITAILIPSVGYLWPQPIYWSPNCPLTLFCQPSLQVTVKPSLVSLAVSWCPDWIRKHSHSRFRNIFPLLNAILSVSG